MLCTLAEWAFDSLRQTTQCDGNCDPDSACPAPVVPPRPPLPPLEQLEVLPSSPADWLRPAAGGACRAVPHPAFVAAMLGLGSVAVVKLVL